MIKKITTFRKLSSHHANRSRLSFSIVNTKMNGKRIRLSSGLMREMGSPESIEIYENEESTGICIVSSESGMPLKENGIIYNSEVVENLTNAFQIDFSDCTSRSFSDIEIKEEDGEKYAEVIINSPSVGKNESIVTEA